MQRKDNQSLTVNIAGEELTLLPERALLWQEQSTLLISDVHLGKIDHFRKNGLPIPGHASLNNYERLDHLLTSLDINRVVFLGDLFHSVKNSDWEVCKAFLSGYPKITFSLVIGNHDIIDIKELESTFECVHKESLFMGPYALSHEPEIHKNYYNICGHIHPGHRLKKNRQPAMRLPCYWFREQGCILPAFGSFTGMHTINPSIQDLIFVIADNEVIRCQ